jgi:hypothetical protein
VHKGDDDNDDDIPMSIFFSTLRIDDVWGLNLINHYHKYSPVYIIKSN